MHPGGIQRTCDFVTCGDARIEVTAEGAGPAVVLLPSRGRGSGDFDDVARGIANAGHRVLCPQPRGAGRSTGPATGLTLHDFARDVAAVIEHAGQGSAVVIGHAFGSWIARLTAADHPRLVRGVGILAAACRDYPDFPGGAALSEAVRRAGDPSLSDAERLDHLREAFFAPGHDPRAWLKGWYPEAGESQLRAARATRREVWWGGGAAPLLDIQGALDPFRPHATRNDLEEALGGRVATVVIADASHALLPEQPAAVIGALLAWMRELPA